MEEVSHRFKMQASTPEKEACGKPGTRNVPAGRWMKVQGMFERRADIGSLIAVHVGVDQRCRAFDVESSAPLPNMSTRNVPLGRWMKV